MYDSYKEIPSGMMRTHSSELAATGDYWVGLKSQNKHLIGNKSMLYAFMLVCLKLLRWTPKWHHLELREAEHGRSWHNKEHIQS